ncbi:MAG: hypothetical protein WKF70_07350 [Chitinophagaceae bacterium]
MTNKFTIKKVLVLAAWLLVGMGMIVLLAAANRAQQDKLCKRVVVNVQGGEKMYIERADVLQEVRKAAGGSLVNKPVRHIDLVHLEKSLEKHPWIQDAKVYFDSHSVLRISVAERQPLARIFTTTGRSYYIDSSGQRLPLLDKLQVRILVVTNFTAARHFTSADSALMKSVKSIAQYITTHPFWSAQITQVEVTSARTFELVPLIGNHTIRIGTADNLEEKLNRLLLFYKQVALTTGFDRYAVLDVQYNGQVIGSKSRYASAVDSLQLQKNIQALIKKARDISTQDSLTEIAAFNASVQRDSTIKNLMITLEESQRKEREKLDSAVLISAPSEDKPEQKTALSGKKPVLKSITPTITVRNKPVEKGKPKAIMKKKQ